MTVADTGNLVGVFKLLLNIAPYKRPYSLLPLINEQPLKQGMHGERSALAVGLAPFEIRSMRAMRHARYCSRHCGSHRSAVRLTMK